MLIKSRAQASLQIRISSRDPEQLRNEIILHTCHKLLDKVELFNGLPASVVGSVLGCLRAEVYLPNDLVLRAGDIGDCMYFIANGSVAVYSLKGVEVCMARWQRQIPKRRTRMSATCEQRYSSYDDQFTTQGSQNCLPLLAGITTSVACVYLAL